MDTPTECHRIIYYCVSPTLYLHPRIEDQSSLTSPKAINISGIMKAIRDEKNGFVTELAFGMPFVVTESQCWDLVFS